MLALLALVGGWAAGVACGLIMKAEKHPRKIRNDFMDDTDARDAVASMRDSLNGLSREFPRMSEECINSMFNEISFFPYPFHAAIPRFTSWVNFQKRSVVDWSNAHSRSFYKRNVARLESIGVE